MQEFDDISLTIGSTVLIGYMLFIIWQLARESNAGKWGTFVLFLVLAVGMLGFVAKQIIPFFLDV